jgi:predicted dehydrogenase
MATTCQGNLLEQGTHIIDMALFFSHYAPVEWVVAQVGELHGLRKPSASAPDLALAEMAFSNGVRCVMEFGTLGRLVAEETNKWWRFAIEVCGEKGRLRVTLNSGAVVEFFDGRPRIEWETNWDRDFPGALVRHFELVVKNARGGSVPLFRPENALLSFNVVMAIYQSALSHARVAPTAGLWPDVVEKLSRLAQA